MMFIMIAVFTPVMKVDLLLRFPQEKRGGLFSLSKWLISSCVENVCLSVFSKLWKIFGRLVHVNLKNNGLVHLISRTLLSNCKWCIPLKLKIRRQTKLCDL